MKLPPKEDAKNRGKREKEGREEFRSLIGAKKWRENQMKEGNQGNRCGVPREMEMTQEENGGNGRGSRGIEIVEKCGKPSEKSGNRGGEEGLAGTGKGGKNGTGVVERLDDEILGFGG